MDPYGLHLREFVLTTVILLPGVGNPGSVLGGLTPFHEANSREHEPNSGEREANSRER